MVTFAVQPTKGNALQVFIVLRSPILFNNQASNHGTALFMSLSIDLPLVSPESAFHF